MSKLILPVGGGLQVKRYRPLLKAPANFERPNAIGNWEYLTPLENQGSNPWCAAYAGCQYLQASFWRDNNFKAEFSEEKLYWAAKAIDRNRNDGTSLESIIYAAQANHFGNSHGAPTIIPELCSDWRDLVFFIHRYGFVLIGMIITDGWLFDDGRVRDSDVDLGGHALIAHSYDAIRRVFWVANWWGRDKGANGSYEVTFDQMKDQFCSGYGLDIQWRKAA